MRKIVLSLICLWSVTAIGQVQQDFSNYASMLSSGWQGDTARFGVNTSQQLQLNDGATGVSCLSVPIDSLMPEMEWRLWVKLSFKTSANNHARFYLLANRPELEQPLTGYFVEIGGQNDSIDLYRQHGSALTKLISGTQANTNHTTNELFIQVTRKARGLWVLQTISGHSGEALVEGTCHDSTVAAGSYAGLYCKYTVSNARKFYFDDFYCGPVVYDTQAPYLTGFGLTSDTGAVFTFSEAIQDSFMQVSVNQAIIPAVHIHPLDDGRSYRIDYAFTDNATYACLVGSVSDLAGNLMNDTMVVLNIPGTVYPRELVINEVLFNPAPNGVDFVEIYNNSQTMADLSGLFLATVDAWQEIKSVYPVSKVADIMMPDTYRVLTKDTAVLKKLHRQAYAPALKQMSTLPSFPDESGTVLLLDADSQVIDRFDYHEDMHFQLLNSVEGVSLERIRADALTNDRDNWHSAASSAGFATPGYHNSQRQDQVAGQQVIRVEPEVFSPDNDGYNDYLGIYCQLPEPGWMCNITVFNPNGIRVHTISRNEPLAASSMIQWDGTIEAHKKAPIGMYVLYIELFDLFGHVKRYKETVVLSGKI